jgi:hypothetical protein
MLDRTAIILLRESICSRSTNGGATIFLAREVNALRMDARNFMYMRTFVGNVSRSCRNRLWLLVLEEVRYAKH